MARSLRTLACIWTSLLFPLVLTACGDDADDDGGDGEGGSTQIDPGEPETVCLDGAGSPVASCAVDPSSETCETGDANDCYAVEREEIWADDGENGVCFFLVAKNVCESTLYSVTCIEHTETAGLEWQCWYSTTLPGQTLDVSQCNATGSYKHVSTRESGKLNLLAEKCDY